MDWNMILMQPIQSLLTQLFGFLPNFLGALLILLVGWLIAKALESVVVGLLKTVQLDRLAERIQLADVLTKGGIRQKLSELIGVIIYWLAILMVVIAALNALQLTVAAQLLEQVVTFLPNVVASIFILIVGIFAASFVAATVRTAASNAGVSQSQVLSEIVQGVVIIFSGVAALQQLGIQFVGEVFLIILAGFSLALGLAFGLGCKDRAGRWLESFIEQLSSRKR
ncbi:MAG: hypothetical protein HYY91_03370 [Candidatus Omnitrophica bacterium]|nr:hypothetical protein [Candidatus Omnitrophota bacterium]